MPAHAFTYSFVARIVSRRNGLEMSAGVFPMLSSIPFPFPMRGQFENAEQHHKAVLTWAEATGSHAGLCKGGSSNRDSLFRKKNSQP
jgi:hypothetical protein